MVQFLIQTVTKVFLASTYVLCNGALVAPMGTSMIGCIAHKHHIPVIVVCETYKFEDRVNLDQINNNEQGSSKRFVDNHLRKTCENKECLDVIVKKNTASGKKSVTQSIVSFLDLKYDLTPLKYLSIIVCEIGNIPPHSVPVVIREIINDYEDEDR